MEDNSNVTISMAEYVRLQNAEMEKEKLKKANIELAEEKKLAEDNCKKLQNQLEEVTTNNNEEKARQEKEEIIKVANKVATENASLELGVVSLLRLIGEKELNIRKEENR